MFKTPKFLANQIAVRDNEHSPPKDRLRAAGTIRFTWKLELIGGNLVLLIFAILFLWTFGWWGIVFAMLFVCFALKLTTTALTGLKENWNTAIQIFQQRNGEV